MSEEARGPPERREKDPLEDTQEMERIRAPGFHSDAIDPWNDVTPQELSGDVPAVVTAVEDEHEAAEDLFLGDGPFASPVDRPIEDKPMRIADPRSPSALSRYALAGPMTLERNAPGRAGSSIRLGDAAVAITRRVPSTVGRAMVERERPTEIVRAHHEAPSPARKYPKMRALLNNPEKVPYGSAAPAKPKPPPVPGTFIPASKKERPPPVVESAPGDLDEMLATMAEGLLIGEDATGHTEVRVTLRDEFFAGTELRITLGEDGISAILVPPDRMTYMTLNGNIDDLRLRLESRGLRVSKIKVSEP